MDLKKVSISKLIQSYKDDFTSKTGEYIKIFTCSKFESKINLSDNVNPYTIALVVCRFTGWNWQDVLDGSRNNERVLARQIFSAILRYNDCGFVFIGKFLHKDHSSIMHNVKAFEDHYSNEINYKHFYEEIALNLMEHYHDYEKITKEQFEKLILE